MFFLQVFLNVLLNLTVFNVNKMLLVFQTSVLWYLIGLHCSLIHAALPPDCVPLEEHPLDTADPGSIFGETSEVGSKASPHRTGNLRQRGAIPTHHFAANEIKSAEPVPMRLFPYEGIFY